MCYAYTHINTYMYTHIIYMPIETFHTHIYILYAHIQYMWYTLYNIQYKLYIWVMRKWTWEGMGAQK